MTHIWQHQSGIFLPLKRVPWARYDYAVKPGWTLKKYGLEQQAEIVRHAFLIGLGGGVPGRAAIVAIADHPAVRRGGVTRFARLGTGYKRN